MTTDFAMKPRHMAKLFFIGAIIWFFTGLLPLHAVIFYSTADPTYNTTAPTDLALVGSGWEWQGNWGGFLGTPIGPHHFLAAQHIGGAVGDIFTYLGADYTTTAYFDDPSSDLRIWQVSGTFPNWAQLYRANNEVGKPLVVFGRGLSRGAEVRVGTVLKGWQWGGNGGVMRWGQNVVSGLNNTAALTGGLLRAAFDAPGGANEGHLAVGDSSGGVFLQDGTIWKLAGINYAVDSSFNTTSTGAGFNAALFDLAGLYYGSQTNGWTYISGHIPSSFYATRVSLRAAWIDSIVPPQLPPADTSDVPLGGPAFAIVFMAFLFATGAWKLRRKSF